MKIETMQKALFDASVLVSIANLGMPQSAYRQRTLNETAMLAARLQYGIMRRYVRLQQENAMLRDSVEFWKAEALKDGNDE